ncbi:hypothetical protein B0H67DRAFT_607143 [Lasiosphaeris hirsuta]|uniref:Uncharacterized protein n=1 Tax=Lasiosphaeris hirsuta TaxID=260670 RepID=A0AA40AZ66_9PEZI|nr:hypothetical protein B0H67DRAFT_607143 [Lasiosphaeris hirsuta]
MLNLVHILTATLALSAGVVGITIPANQTEGVYTVTTGADGQDVFVRIGDITPGPLTEAAAISGPGRLGRRATTWPQKTNPICPEARYLKHYDFYDGGAWQGFYSSCQSVGDTRFKNGKAVYAFWGGAVAYMCSYQSNPCNVQEWVDAVNWVQNSCRGVDGPYFAPGYLSIPAWKKAYGYANSETSFC